MSAYKRYVRLFTLMLLGFLMVQCEEPDTTAPTVTISYPAHKTSVSEVVNVTCVATDNVGIESVELWIDGVSTGLTDNTEPYSFSWNTTQYEDGSTHVITVRGNDVNDNEGDSNPITVHIDQTDAYPEAVNIASVDYSMETMTVTWEMSQDSDFSRYELYYGVETTSFDLMTTIEVKDSTTYSLTEFNPLIYNYFQIVVYDTLGLKSTGNYLSNALHSSPNPVTVTEVAYTLTEMTISWGTYVTNLARMQSMLAKHSQSPSLLNGTDFISYELLYSETEAGNKTTLAIFTDIDSTTCTLTEFDPTHENWYWIKVTDFWGFTSTGAGRTNAIDNAPTAINVTSVDYTLSEMTISWPQSSDNDFVSYELLYSETEEGSQSSLGIFAESAVMSFVLTEYDPTHENWFWVKVTDFWGLTSMGAGRTNTIDSVPTSIDIVSVEYDTTAMTVTWSQSPDLDFASYEVLHAESETGVPVSLETITDQATTSLAITEFDPTKENWYSIRATDFWGLTSLGARKTHTLHTAPDSVDVVDVSYTLSDMTITWKPYVADLARTQSMLKLYGQTMSVLNGTDFISYELLYSETEGGNKESIATIMDIDSTTFTLIEFDPTHENWFWVKVTDYWGLASTGIGNTNTIDSVPTAINVTSVDYTLSEMTIPWPQSSDNDFVSYELLYSETETGDKTTITTITNIDSTTFTLIEFDPTHENWFWVKVTDYWGLASTGIGKTNTIDSPPIASFMSPIDVGTDSYTISWAQNQDDDFASYSVYESLYDDMNSSTLICTSMTVANTSYTITALVEDEYRYYQVVTNDHWGLASGSNIETYFVSSGFMQTFGGSEYDWGNSVQQTSDGGYIIAGSTTSFGNIYMDAWLIKTDSGGTEEWNRTFGGNDSEGGSFAQQTSDGGYILTGYAESNETASKDVWLIKTDTDGNAEWSRTFGGIETDMGRAVQQTNDGGYIITGQTESYGNGSIDVWLIKIDAGGAEEWNKTFGGSSVDAGYSVQQTSDGGYIITGGTSSFGSGGSDVWLIKTDASGNEVWNRTFGGSEGDWGKSVQQTDDGGHIITGGTSSFGNGGSDAWLIKVDASGNEEWNRTFGGSEDDGGNSVQQTSDGGYIIAGSTRSYGNGSYDVWLIKTDVNGDEEWIRTLTLGNGGADNGKSVCQTSDGGYIVTGETGSYGNGGSDIWLIKMNTEGTTVYPDPLLGIIAN